MTCGCQEHRPNRPPDGAPGADINDYTKAPTEPCLLCAEKHLATASELAGERGYEAPNRQRIIGQLVLAQWHLWPLAYDLATAIRDARHILQQRAEAESPIDWDTLLTQIDTLLTATPQKEPK